MFYLLSKEESGVAKATPVSTPTVTSRFVYGMPTTGKSYLEKALNDLALQVVDTDVILRTHFPEWAVLRIYTKSKWNDTERALNSFLSTGVGSLVGNNLGMRDSVVLTNMQSKRFYSLVRQLVPSLAVIGFTRNLTDLTFLWVHRNASGISTAEEVKHWKTSVSDLVDYFPEGTLLIDLPTGMFMTDYTGLVDGNLSIVPLGIKELAMLDEEKEAALKGEVFFQIRWLIAEFCEYLIERKKPTATAESRAKEFIDTLGVIAKFNVSADLGKYYFDPALILEVQRTLGALDKVQATIEEHYESWSESQKWRGRQVIPKVDILDGLSKFMIIFNNSFNNF